MKKKIILIENSKNLQQRIAVLLIEWFHEMNKHHGSNNEFYTIQFRMPVFNEVNMERGPIELCSRRVMELTCEDFPCDGSCNLICLENCMKNGWKSAVDE